MIRAILVDDEPINISNLKALLARHCQDIDVVAIALNADSALAHILELQPDVVFLDIEMPGKTGFDLLRSVKEPNFDIVFVTAFDAYGIMAIKFSALDYLLKTINIRELKDTVGRIKKSVDAKKQDLRLNNLLSLLDRKTLDDTQKIALHLF